MGEPCSIFVGNLADRVKYHHIEDFFKDFGKLQDVTLKVDFIRKFFQSEKNRVVLTIESFLRVDMVSLSSKVIWMQRMPLPKWTESF